MFALLFTEKRILHCSTFMNACDSHILDVSHMSKAREVRSELIPVSHGNPHPTCILSQRMCCNEHIYHNLHTKGHSSQDVECFCTLINSICLKIIQKRGRNINIKMLLLNLHTCTTPFLLYCLGWTQYFQGSKNQRTSIIISISELPSN